MGKYSKYNFLFQNGNKGVLFNLTTSRVMVLDEKIVEIIKQHKENIDFMKDISSPLYEEMEKNGMIVNDECNEAEDIIAKWDEGDKSQSGYHLTILPTLNCNLRCWYCYEEHKASSQMTDETMNRILKFLDKKISSEGLKTFNLDFFGGEPLLPFKKRVLPIIQYAANACKEHGVNMFLNFTTNGVLLTEEVRKELLKIPLADKPGFQITIDGNEEKHNKSRCTASGEPTYRIILDNLFGAVRAGMRVNCRFNYTEDNIDSLVDVLDDFEELTPEERKLIFFDFQQVWQEKSKTEVREKALNLANLFMKEDQQVRIEKNYNNQRCRDDAENQASINFDGNVYKCTAINITPDIREGVLNADGEIEWNERFHKRMALKYGNKHCKACVIYPICHGGCSQTKLDADENAECLFGLDDNAKLERVRGRLEYILRTGRVSY